MEGLKAEGAQRGGVKEISSSLFFGLVLSDFQNLLYRDRILLKDKCVSVSRDVAECW